MNIEHPIQMICLCAVFVLYMCIYMWYVWQWLAAILTLMHNGENDLLYNFLSH